MHQSPNQPTGRQCRRGGDPQLAVGVGDAARRPTDALECCGDLGQQDASLFRQRNALRPPAEQRDAKMLLEQLHVTADRALRDVQLVGRAGKALMACSGFEGAQCVQRRQSHGSS